MRVIRDGWTLDDFEKLKQMQDTAEQDYLEEVARRYSNAYSSMLIRGSGRWQRQRSEYSSDTPEAGA